MEEVMLGDMTAALLDRSTLVWEEAGRSFQLIGPSFDVEMLLQIAESLEPVQ